MDNKQTKPHPSNTVHPESDQLETISIQVTADLHRAFQRCSWLITNETGKSRLDIMDEMVRDFLIKHGC